MTEQEAKRRLEVWLKCMDCPEDKQCYDSHLHSTCEYTDYCDETPISEAVKVAIKALEQEPCDDAMEKARRNSQATDFLAEARACAEIDENKLYRECTNPNN